MTDQTYPALPQNHERVALVDSHGDPIKAIPDVLITSGGEDGRAPRIRVDPGQTGFFDGRMFRAFMEGIIPVAGPAVQFRFVAPINFILWTQELALTQGALQLEVYSGATGSGTWTELPVIGINRMSERPTPLYVNQCTIAFGGNFSGGTKVDVMKLRTAQNNTAANNVGGSFAERGLPATTFYGRLSTLTGGLTVNDAAHYVYQLAWEERP